jgi:hypothetical protein
LSCGASFPLRGWVELRPHSIRRSLLANVGSMMLW